MCNSENAFLRILSHAPRRDAVEQAEVFRLLGLRLARVLKGQSGQCLLNTMGGGLEGIHCPCSQGLKDRDKVLGTLVQIDDMRGPIHRNESPSPGRLVLETA